MIRPQGNYDLLQRVRVTTLASNILQQVEHLSIFVREDDGRTVETNTFTLLASGQEVKILGGDTAL
jgi:hypothetical protein